MVIIKCPIIKVLLERQFPAVCKLDGFSRLIIQLDQGPRKQVDDQTSMNSAQIVTYMKRFFKCAK